MAVLGLGFCISGWGAQRPSVQWTSYPASTGEHVLLQGGGWGQTPQVEIDGRRAATTALSDNGLVFPFPDGGERIVTGRVIGEGGASEPFVINAPTVWWLQGDGGDTSTPGGTLRVFGRSLAPAAERKGAVSTWKARVQSGVRVKLGDRELPLARTDVWSLDATVPADLPPGTYDVQVSNGLKGGAAWTAAGTWTVAPARRVWKDDRFDVMDFGAEPNDADDDSDAFEAAMSAAQKNGGGTVFVPCGRFVLSRTLTIPPHVLLKGEDRSLSQICWPDTMRPPENLVEGSHSFGIHDLFISSGLYRNGIVAKNDMSAQGCMAASRGTLTHDVSLKRLRVKLVSDQWRDERNLQNFLPRYSLRGDGIVVRNCLRGEIEDCVIYCDKDAQRTLFFNFTGDYIRMANCRISGSGWAVFGGDRCIYENNDANNCTYSISSVCRRMFWSGNRQTDLFTNNREAVTHDGAKTAWCARKRGEQGCASGVVEGTRVKLTLPPDVIFKAGTNFLSWVGCELQVTDGTGAGQTRTITSMRSYEDLTLDRPFDIAPDATSLFVVCAERRHLLYVDNDIEDAGVAIQLYGGVTDCVVARNRCRRAGGFHGSGRDYHGVITCWYVQFLGNVVEEGNCHRGAIGTDFRGVGTSLIGAFPPNVKWPFSQGYVYRDNEIRSNGSMMISVKNALVERNTVRRSAVGLVSRRYQETLFVSSNVFDRVTQPYKDLAGARIQPPYVDRQREGFLSALKAGVFPKRRSVERRAFGFELKAQPWNKAMRAAAEGRSRTPFDLPVTLSVGGALAEDVSRVTLRLAPGGGWDFGGDVTLARGKDGFAGKVRVTPPKTGPVGLFAWEAHVEAAGEGWTYATDLMAEPLTQNRFLSWESGLAPAGKQPSSWRRVAFMEGMDGHEQVFADRLWGDRLKDMDCHLRTRIRVLRETTFLFTRGDWTCSFLVDGRLEAEPGVNTTTTLKVTLEPGEHVFELVRPAKSGLVRKPQEGMFLRCTFPRGCPPGSWVQLGDEPNAIYVSPKAGSVRDGSRAHPFATPDEARQALRKLRAQRPGAWTVELDGGDYPVRAPLVFESADSGTPDAPVTWKGPADGPARLVGGIAIGGWRVRPDGRWETDVPKGADGKPLWFEQLFVNGVRAQRARLPNAGFFTPAAVRQTVTTNDRPRYVWASAELTGRTNDLAALAKTDPAAFKWAHLVVHHNWDSTRRIVAGFDAARNTLLTRGEIWKHWNPWRTNSLYYVENVPEALDAPGEWLYDGQAKKLVYVPRAGETPAAAITYAPVPGLRHLLLVRGDPAKGVFVHDLVFENLSFAFTDSPRRPQFLCHSGLPAEVTGDVAAPGPSQWPPMQASAQTEAAILADGAHRLVFRGCSLAHTGEYGLWLREGCVSNRFERCAFEDLGAGGLRIGLPAATQKVGKGERVTRLENGRGTGYNTVDNCIVAHGGRVHAPGVGVWIGSSPFNRVTHCEIADFYYTGVSIGWVWGYSGSMAQGNTLAYCHIHRIGQRALGDMGGVYTLGTSFGTRIANNVIHDVDSFTYGGWGLYPDEGSEGLLLENNLVYDTKDASFHQHYGRDNVLRNNILAYSREGQVAVTRAEPHRSLTVERNIVFWDRGKTFTRYRGTLQEKAKIDWKGNFWWKTSEPLEFNGKTFAAWQAKGNDRDGLAVDPGFADAAARDFRLRPDSPVVKAGFRPFDISAAGVYGDPAWIRRAGKFMNLRDGVPNAAYFARKNVTGNQYFFGLGDSPKTPWNEFAHIVSKDLGVRAIPHSYPEPEGARFARYSCVNGQAIYGQRVCSGYLAVLDFSASGAKGDPKREAAYLENLVRAVYEYRRTHSVVILHTTPSPYVAEAEKVAAHYGIPTLDLTDAASAAERTARLKAFAAALFKDAPVPEKPVARTLSAPLYAGAEIRPQIVSYEHPAVKFDDGWLGWQRPNVKDVLHVIDAKRTGAKVTLTFVGSEVGVFDEATPQVSSFVASVDGGAPKTVEPPKDGDVRLRHTPLFAGLDPSREHVLTLEVRTAAPLRLAGFSLSGSVKAPKETRSPLERMCACLEALPPLTYEPPAGRFEHIPKTMRRLREGGELTVVMLGDSIVNDTSASHFEQFLMKRYPKCRIRKVTSVRGSTGCDWYAQENRVREWALRHKPDLMMIGGISHRPDPSKMRDVVRQIRAEKPDVEFLLLAPVFGRETDPWNRDWTLEIDHAKPNWRATIERIAAEEKCAFFDMTGPLGAFIRDSKMTRGAFMRDVVHANDRGHAVLGGLLDRWFASACAKKPCRIDVKPGESLTAVRDRVRALDAAQRGNGVEVRLPPGTYVLPQALTLGKADSGTAGAPVIWRAADPKDRPHLVGGDAIPASAFKSVADPELVARLDPEARGKVLETDISGIRFAWPKPQKIPCELRPPLKVPDVFAGGRRLTLASFPSEGWSEIVKITDRGAGYGDRTLASALAQGVIKPEDIYGGTFVYREDRPSRWAAHPEVAIEGFWRYDWRNTIIYAKAIDPQAKTITLGAAHSYRLGQGNPAPRRWRALNVFEELNRPGRYAVDFAKRRLYVYPPAGFDGVGVCSSSDPLVRMKDVHDVVLKGLHFGRSAGSGLVLDGTERVIVTHCEFTDARQVAVAASDCRRCEVRTCDFHRLCGGGIRLSGGDRRTLEPGNNLIEDCLFHHWNALSATAMAVNVGGVGNAVRHCVMRDTSHQAAGISGNDCVFEYNVLSNICTGTDDAGAFYKGRNPSAQGNVLRYNYFRNIGRQEIRNGHGSCAVYFDDGDCGETVFGNVFENAGVAGFGNFAAVFSHGGHSNVVRNCLFLDCQRALGSGPWTQKRWAEFLKSDKDAFPVVTRLRKEVDITKPPYTTHYPSLAGFFDPQPDECRWNAAYDNAYVNCPLSLPDAQGQLTKPGLVAGRWFTNATSVVIEGDPGFVNRAAGDLRLRSDSPIYRMIPGFRPIPFEKIGLLTSEDHR